MCVLIQDYDCESFIYSNLNVFVYECESTGFNSQIGRGKVDYSSFKSRRGFFFSGLAGCPLLVCLLRMYGLRKEENHFQLLDEWVGTALPPNDD